GQNPETVPAVQQAKAKSRETSRESIDAAKEHSETVARERAAASQLARTQKRQAMAEQQQKLQTLNDALYQARADMRVARERYAQAVRDGRADFNGGEGY